MNRTGGEWIGLRVTLADRAQEFVNGCGEDRVRFTGRDVSGLDLHST